MRKKKGKLHTPGSNRAGQGLSSRDKARIKNAATKKLQEFLEMELKELMQLIGTKMSVNYEKCLSLAIKIKLNNQKHKTNE